MKFKVGDKIVRNDLSGLSLYLRSLYRENGCYIIQSVNEEAGRYRFVGDDDVYRRRYKVMYNRNGWRINEKFYTKILFLKPKKFKL